MCQLPQAPGIPVVKLVGGLLIGIIENLVAGYLSSTYQGAITFLILILVLAVKPTGLFGRLTTVKV